MNKLSEELTEIADLMLDVGDRLEDEGDRVFLGSTNDADRIRELARRLEGLAARSEALSSPGGQGNTEAQGCGTDRAVSFAAANHEALPDAAEAVSPERGWLIERWNGRTGEFGALWWGLGLDNEDGFGWTPDSLQALRFARKCDAQAYINETGWTDAKPTEHVWHPAPSAASGLGEAVASMVEDTDRWVADVTRPTPTTQEPAPPAESGASGTDGQGPLSVARSARDEHIPPPNPVSHEGK
jgi:hypothetical protein